MGYGRLPLDGQLAGLRALLTRNATLVEVLTRAAVLALPDWYLVAGCLYQTVWNVVTGQPPESGILDYDLAYYDSSDLSWHAEDAIIQEGCRIFGDLPAPVQIRNHARVHLWYEQKFGVPCPPHDCAEAAIDTFEATTACLGLRLEPGAHPEGVRMAAFTPEDPDDRNAFDAHMSRVRSSPDVTLRASDVRWSPRREHRRLPRRGPDGGHLLDRTRSLGGKASRPGPWRCSWNW